MEPDTLAFFGNGACPCRKTGVHPRFRAGRLFSVTSAERLVNEAFEFA
jgi:hypothetical protein